MTLKTLYEYAEDFRKAEYELDIARRNLEEARKIYASAHSSYISALERHRKVPDSAGTNNGP